jgi:hypothetical protein
MSDQPRRAKRPVKVPMHVVMDVMKTIHDQGHSRKFMKEASAAGALATIHPAAFEFVKNFITDNKLDNRAATKRVKLCPHPYDCPDS